MPIDHHHSQTKKFHKQARDVSSNVGIYQEHEHVRDVSLKVGIDQESEGRVHGVVFAGRFIGEQVRRSSRVRFEDEVTGHVGSPRRFLMELSNQRPSSRRDERTGNAPRATDESTDLSVVKAP